MKLPAFKMPTIVWRRSDIYRLGAALLAAAILTGVAGLGRWLSVEKDIALLVAPDYIVSDALFQRRMAASGEIVMVGIDPRSIEAFGLWPWTRDIMAMAVENLNADPENRPAAIGIDVVYGGYSWYPEDDDYLVQTLGEYGNVVVASFAEYGTVSEVRDGKLYIGEDMLAFNEPFPELKAVADQGHINSMFDSDGFLRQGMLDITLPGGTVVPSFNQLLYRKYALHHGLDATRTPPAQNGKIFYIPYTGKPMDYDEGHSILDLFEGNIPEVHGKIVLIGPWDAALQDYVTTSTDHSKKMFGIEAQANMIEMYLRGDFKREASQSVQYVLLFFVSLLALLLMWERKVLASTLIWLGLSGGSVGISYLFYHKLGLVTHVLWVPLSITAIYIATVAINYVRAALERRRVTNTFKRYVAPEIVSEILREGSDALGLGGKLTDIAVLFVDIRGFTPMSEVLTPPQVVDVLNSYLTLTSSAVMANSGTLDKFIGDATMAFWGAPLPHPDPVFSAVKAALDMVAGSEKLSAELEEKFGRSVSFGIGINYGPAVVGNIGAEQRQDYTAIGDTVNTAARLESNAPKGQIYISRAVKAALEGRIRTTEVGAIPLKGKAEGFEVWTVEGLAEENA